MLPHAAAPVLAQTEVVLRMSCSGEQCVPATLEHTGRIERFRDSLECSNNHCVHQNVAPRRLKFATLAISHPRRHASRPRQRSPSPPQLNCVTMKKALLIAVIATLSILWFVGHSDYRGSTQSAAQTTSSPIQTTLPPNKATPQEGIRTARRPTDPSPENNASEAAIVQGPAGQLSQSRTKPYNVIQQIVESVGRLDIEKTIASTQLNPRATPIPATTTIDLRVRLKDFIERDRMLTHEMHAESSHQLARAAADGIIPELNRDLAPALFDRVMTSCRRKWDMPIAVVEHDTAWRDDRPFRMFFLNSYLNALKRTTDYRVRIDLGATDRSYVASYKQCTALAARKLSGQREALEREVCTLLLTVFFTNAALATEELLDLWLLFDKLQGEAGAKTLAAFK